MGLGYRRLGFRECKHPTLSASAPWWPGVGLFALPGSGILLEITLTMYLLVVYSFEKKKTKLSFLFGVVNQIKKK